MKSAAEFCLDWLIDNGKGQLVTAPSTSPEHKFVLPDGRQAAVSQACSMDLALIWDLFTNLLDAIDVLNVDAAFGKSLESALAKLLPYHVDGNGAMQEWFEDFKPAETRAPAHLASVRPASRGARSRAEQTPALFAAARQGARAAR